jgi:hypothetical protein
MFSHVASKASTVLRRALTANLCAGISIAIALLLSSLAFAAAQAAGATSNQASSTGSSKMATVPAGTRIMVRMVDAVDSETSQPDQRFRGALETNLMAGDLVVAPKGATVFGRLLAAESAGSRAGGQLEFDLTDIMIDGQTHSLATSSNQVQGQGASGPTASGGAKTGAAVGAVTGGMGGAIRGAGAGAVAGQVSGANTQGEKVKVPAGTLVEFTLDHPVSLPVTTK